MKIPDKLTHKELIASTISVLISSILVARSVYVTHLAWMETPDVYNFWKYVFPESHKFETKFMYFGIHILFAVVVLLGSSASFFLQKKEKREIKILVAQVFFIIYLCWLQSLTISHAIQAASLS
jgi:hypothetical protein